MGDIGVTIGLGFCEPYEEQLGMSWSKGVSGLYRAYSGSYPKGPRTRIIGF